MTALSCCHLEPLCKEAGPDVISGTRVPILYPQHAGTRLSCYWRQSWEGVRIPNVRTRAGHVSGGRKVRNTSISSE